MLNVESAVQSQLPLDEGCSIAATARLAGIKDSTLRKAIAVGRITKPANKPSSEPPHRPIPTTAKKSRHGAAL